MKIQHLAASLLAAAALVLVPMSSATAEETSDYLLPENAIGIDTESPDWHPPAQYALPGQEVIHTEYYCPGDPAVGTFNSFADPNDWILRLAVYSDLRQPTVSYDLLTHPLAEAWKLDGMGDVGDQVGVTFDSGILTYVNPIPGDYLDQVPDASTSIMLKARTQEGKGLHVLVTFVNGAPVQEPPVTSLCPDGGTNVPSDTTSTPIPDQPNEPTDESSIPIAVPADDDVEPAAPAPVEIADGVAAPQTELASTGLDLLPGTIGVLVLGATGGTALLLSRRGPSTARRSNLPS